MELCFVNGAGSALVRGHGGLARSVDGISRVRPAESCRGQRVAVSMSFNGGGKPEGKDRFFAVLPYFLPLLDSLQYGHYLFHKFPAMRDFILVPLAPFYAIYRGFPLVDLIIFFAVFFLVVRNTNINRFIRYNAQQAIMLDLILILPGLFSGVGNSVPRVVAETASNTVFYAMFVAVGYAVVENIKGELPNQIPLVSDSVDQQIGPF